MLKNNILKVVWLFSKIQIYCMKEWIPDRWIIYDTLKLVWIINEYKCNAWNNPADILIINILVYYQECEITIAYIFWAS